MIYQKIYPIFLPTNGVFHEKSPLISSPLNIDVNTPHEFSGKHTVTSVSIFLWVAGSIFTDLGA